jgi:UDP-N-acetylenolpyruvoylglucosamine reductase
VLIMGNGSNLLFSDAGFDGLIIRLGSRFSAIELRDNNTIYCQSGAALLSVCRFAQRSGLSGLEFAYGIPGTVGGAVYMNAGAYAGEMKDALLYADHLTPGGIPGRFGGEALGLDYRKSVYSGANFAITGALLQLTPDTPEAIAARMADFMQRRLDKQPLHLPSAGSTFKRPAGYFAAALIDQCGLKGLRVGGAQVSEKHAGFVVNTGEATCTDVLELIRQVKAIVLEKTGVALECEVQLIGPTGAIHLQ